MRYEATLVEGTTYVLGNTFFRLGETHVVNEETKLHLEENAVIKNKSNSGRVFITPCFEFVELEEEEEKPKKKAAAKKEETDPKDGDDDSDTTATGVKKRGTASSGAK